MIFILFAAGVVAATLGSLLGAGGGFLLIPFLLFLLPADTSAGVISGMSMALALTNGLVASTAYAGQKRIHYAWAIVFASGSIIGAVGGAFVVQYVSRDTYQVIFGTLLVVVSLYLNARPAPQRGSATTTPLAGAQPVRPVPGFFVGLPIGFIAGLVGIGGGIILVPTIVYLFRFVPHIATATSSFTLIFTSLAAITVRAATVDLGGHAFDILFVISGALIGARLGPRISQKVSGPLLMRLLSVALGLTGVTLTLRGLGVLSI